MSTMSIQITPINAGAVNVQVFDFAGGNFNWQGIATVDAPVSQSWTDLAPGYYAVTLSWTEGYHNISSSGGSQISFDGNSLYFQVLGQADQYGEDVSTTIGMQID